MTNAYIPAHPLGTRLLVILAVESQTLDGFFLEDKSYSIGINIALT
jgi:hypothetical protein